MLPYLCLLLLFNSVSCNELQITQTVYGFLDFTTTIGNTVMVFSPQSAPPIVFTEEPLPSTTSKPISIIETRPNVHEDDAGKNVIKPTPLAPSIVEREPETASKSETKTETETSSSVSSSNTPIQTLDHTEYALLSRQPEQFAEETFRLVNLKSRSDSDRQRPYQPKRDNNYNLSTNIYAKKVESSTIKNYSTNIKISTKQHTEKRSKIRAPSSSSRVLKTVTSTVQATRAPVEIAPQQSSYSSKSNRDGNRKTGEKRKSSRNKGKRRHKNTHSQSSSIQITATAVEPSSRRSFRTKTAQHTEEVLPVTSLSQNNLKLNRRPGRWQYKSAPKPKVNIRKNASNSTKSAVGLKAENLNETIVEAEEKYPTQKILNLGRDLDALGSQNSVVPDNDELKPLNFVRTLNVEISTPSDFGDTYYEIATIKSPFVFQAGLVKKTRFLTITSTIEKTLKTDQIEEYNKEDGPLTENILESTTPSNSEAPLDGSISTLKAVYITEGLETPELDTITESFTITQTKLKTQILPIVFEKNNETVQMTLVQTFDYTSLVTVTQTVSPYKDNFIPSKNFKDFAAILDEAGSELNLDLEFADESNAGQYEAKQSPNNAEVKGLFNATNVLPPIQLNSPEKLNNQELSPLNVLNPNNNVITTTRPVIKHETLWESYVVPLQRGTDTVLRTLSKSVGVVEKTDYVTEVSTIAAPMSQQFPYSINPFYNPLLALQQPQLITSTSVYESLVTATSSKVLKLTFGARTAYTTIFSTSVVPSEVTKLITATVSMPNSGSFPNYYPPPYPPFAYVG